MFTNQSLARFINKKLSPMTGRTVRPSTSATPSWRGRMLLPAAGLCVAFASGASAANPACNTAWSAATAYTGGQHVSYEAVNYTANWWTQNQNPSANSGASGSGEPWTSNGACGGSSPTPPPPPPPPPPPQPPVPPPPSVPPSTGARFFSPYVDMSLSNDEQILTMQQQAGLKALTMAFLVGSTNTCNVEWGGYSTPLPADNLWDGVSIQSIVQILQKNGVQVTLSLGGATGPEPALTCTNVTQLQALYQSVITRYKVNRLDFDIEGTAVTDPASITRRDQALKALKAANPSLIISYTLPVLPTGLDSDGVNILNKAKSDGVTLNAVNIMAMDYGSNIDNGGKMDVDAADAAAATENQLIAAKLTSTTIGIIPMIGVNDTRGETFTLANAQTLLTFAEANKYITSLGMWSLARDNGSCSGTTTASPTCSGLSQASYAFSATFNEVK